MPSVTLDLDKKYNFPEIIDYEKIAGKFLIIAREQANWLLLNDKIEVQIFDYLREGKNLEECFQKYGTEYPNEVINVLREIEAKHFESREVQYTPTTGMYIYLTNNCNERCHHCYMYAGHKKEEELTTKEIIQLLQNFSNNGGKSVTFTGGEATTREDFPIILFGAKKAGLITGLLSNGLLLDKAYVRKIADSLDEAQVSIDGYNAESYETVRAYNGFQKALEAVDNLVQADIRTTVGITPLYETLISKEKEYQEFASKLLKKYKGKEFFVKFNTELLDGRDINPSVQENNKYREAAQRIREICTPMSKAQGFALDHYANAIFDNCGYGSLAIAANGDVYFCNLIFKCHKQGNIRTDSVEKLLHMSQQARKQSNINRLSPCNNCSLKYLCGGGCRIKNFSKLVNKSFREDKELKIIERDIPCTRQNKEKILYSMIEANPYMYRE